MRIMLITDAWKPQINGVVRTLMHTVENCRIMGHEVDVITPYDGFKTMPLPTYPDIKLALFCRKEIVRRMEKFQPEAVHIATEGTLGLTVRSICLGLNMPFTTSYHTKFPEYLTARLPFIPVSLGYVFMRWFHKPSGNIMVATQAMRDHLSAKGFQNIVPWTRGVDTNAFRPIGKDEKFSTVYQGLKRPIYLNVGRVSIEKNLTAFLDLDLEGTKVVVGSGPALEDLQKKYPKVVFAGMRFKEELRYYYADADVFIFPSLTDTFGLVILEAMACGTPVAGFPTAGPVDLIPSSGAGAIDKDLKKAIKQALSCDTKQVRAYALRYSWNACTEEFIRNLSCPPPPVRKRIWRRLGRLLGRRRKNLKHLSASERRRKEKHNPKNKDKP